MNRKAIKLAGCFAWVGAGLSSANPVDARALTRFEFGDYSNCSASYSPLNREWCYGMWNYTQNIKFNMKACSSGACSIESGGVYVESIYAAGRKTVTQESSCSEGYIYGLGSCAC